MELLGLSLFYVGVVLIINGIWLIGKLEKKSVAPINFMVAGLMIFGVLRIIFTGTDMSEYYSAAGLLLFAFTYLGVALNNTFNLDGKALGWYSLLVVIAAIPFGILNLPDLGQFGLWMMWATLWFLYFVLLAFEMNKIKRITGLWTTFNGIVTGFAGFIILIEQWPW